MDKIDIRQELHRLSGHLRQNSIIDAYDLLKRMIKQMDDEYYSNPENFKEDTRNDSRPKGKI
jgi:hypothetical protein